MEAATVQKEKLQRDAEALKLKIDVKKLSTKAAKRLESFKSSKKQIADVRNVIFCENSCYILLSNVFIAKLCVYFIFLTCYAYVFETYS